MPSDSGDTNRGLDVVVIGAGPAGEAAAQLAGTLGYSVALVERDTVGGTASEIADIGQAMLHNEATVEDVARMVYNTPTYSTGTSWPPPTPCACWTPRCCGPCCCRRRPTGSEDKLGRSPFGIREKIKVT